MFPDGFKATAAGIAAGIASGKSRLNRAGGDVVGAPLGSWGVARRG